jgi:hypothetical protein
MLSAPEPSQSKALEDTHVTPPHRSPTRARSRTHGKHRLHREAFPHMPALASPSHTRNPLMQRWQSCSASDLNTALHSAGPNHNRLDDRIDGRESSVSWAPWVSAWSSDGHPVKSPPTNDVCRPAMAVGTVTIVVCNVTHGVCNRTSVVCTLAASVCNVTNGMDGVAYVVCNVTQAFGRFAYGHCRRANTVCSPANIVCGPGWSSFPRIF